MRAVGPQQAFDLPAGYSQHLTGSPLTKTATRQLFQHPGTLHFPIRQSKLPNHVRPNPKGDISIWLEGDITNLRLQLDDMLVDGGFAKLDDIEQATARGVTVYAPVPKPRDATRDAHAPLPSDSEAIAAWRARMGTEAAGSVYKDRAATAECVNAQARNRGLQRFLVRGLPKVRSIALLYALAHNLARMMAFQAAGVA